MKSSSQSRRAFVKKLAYVVPVVVSLEAVPTFARAGSGTLDRGPGRFRSTGPRQLAPGAWTPTTDAPPSE